MLCSHPQKSKKEEKDITLKTQPGTKIPSSELDVDKWSDSEADDYDGYDEEEDEEEWVRWHLCSKIYNDGILEEIGPDLPLGRHFGLI